MAIAAKFRNNGQVCISPNRFYIHEKKKDEFANLMIEKTKKLKIGNGMDKTTILGPLTTKQRLDGVEKLVEKTKQEGGKVLLGGKRPSGFNKGYFYEPTIFDNIKDDFTIMREEPLVHLFQFYLLKDFDEVIERANNNDLGLCSYIYTNDLKRAHKNIRINGNRLRSSKYPGCSCSGSAIWRNKTNRIWQRRWFNGYKRLFKY